MYSQGENFYYEIEGEEYELTVLENFIIDDIEYLVSEDFDGDIHVFMYNEEDDDIHIIEDIDEKDTVINYWKNEVILGDDIGDYEDDEYYDREDSFVEDYDSDEYIIEDGDDGYY